MQKKSEQKNAPFVCFFKIIVRNAEKIKNIVLKHKPREVFSKKYLNMCYHPKTWLLEVLNY